MRTAKLAVQEVGFEVVAFIAIEFAVLAARIKNVVKVGK